MCGAALTSRDGWNNHPTHPTVETWRQLNYCLKRVLPWVVLFFFLAGMNKHDWVANQRSNYWKNAHACTADSITPDLLRNLSCTCEQHVASLTGQQVNKKAIPYFMRNDGKTEWSCERLEQTIVQITIIIETTWLLVLLRKYNTKLK